MPRATVALVGDGDGSVQELLRDVLSDLELELAEHATPDLVLAVVGKRELAVVVAEARRRAGTAPVLAILPIDDARRVRASLAGGADAAHALDAPLASFTRAVLALLERRARQTSPAAGPSGFGRNE